MYGAVLQIIAWVFLAGTVYESHRNQKEKTQHLADENLELRKDNAKLLKDLNGVRARVSLDLERGKAIQSVRYNKISMALTILASKTGCPEVPGLLVDDVSIERSNGGQTTD